MNQPRAMQTPVPSTPAAEEARRTPPACLFIGLIALAIITVLTLFSAMARGSVAGFAAVVGNLALLVGLVLGHRWAYVLAVLFSVAGIAVAFGKSAAQGLIVLISNSVVLVPVLLSTRYFFPGQAGADLSDAGSQHANHPGEAP